MSFVDRYIGTIPGINSIDPEDIDGDGDWDISFAASASTDLVGYVRNDGGSSYTDVSLGSVDDATAVKAIDLDNDGAIDIVVANPIDDAITAFWNDGSQNFTEDKLTSAVGGIVSYELFIGVHGCPI